MKQLLDTLRHWWWLILLCTAAAAISSYYSTGRMAPEYEARATLVVGNTIHDPNPTAGEYNLQQQLAAAYANIGSRQIAAPAMQTLGLSVLPEYTVHPIANSPLIEIIVSDTNPTRAQAVANELANQMLRNSPSSASSPEEQERLVFVNQQLDNLQQRIDQSLQEIEAAQQRLSETVNARQITDMQAQITALDAKLTTLQTTYADLLASTQQGSVNELTILQLASLPTRPVGPNRLLYIALASLIGLGVASAVSYGLELLDTRVRSGAEISALLETPVLGQFPNLSRKEQATTYTLRNPRAPVTDAFRTLRTNLEFLNAGAALKTILVSGAYTADGKSTVAANLAAIIAQANRSVILVEADLRRPNLHQVLHVNGGPGVSDICAGRTDAVSALINLDLLLQDDLSTQPGEDPVPVEGKLRFLPAGTLPPNPAELLASPRFEVLLDTLAQQAEWIIIDSPPILLPDAATLLNKVDGVLLVFQPSITHRRTIVQVKDQIARSGARLLGVVLNRTGSARQYQAYQSIPLPRPPAP